MASHVMLLDTNHAYKLKKKYVLSILFYLLLQGLYFLENSKIQVCKFMIDSLNIMGCDFLEEMCVLGRFKCLTLKQ